MLFLYIITLRKNILEIIVQYIKQSPNIPVSYTHLTLPTIYSV